MTSRRKANHLEICLNQKVEVGSTGFEKYHFIHNALPEIDFRKIDLAISSLGRKVTAPLFTSSMTGGTAEAAVINKNLAIAAYGTGIPMAVGSQRVALEDPSLAFSFQVRKYAPKMILFGNLGAVQLNYGYDLKECQRAIEMIKADGIILHLNPLQEAVQPGGNKNFSKLLLKIKNVSTNLKYPVIVKEVGAGISKEVALKLYQAGIKIIDVAGWGGTNWALIESLRRKGDHNLGKMFSNWGIPTAEAIKECRRVKKLFIIGSGGIRNGIEIAKALTLGANLVGIALPLLAPARKSPEAVKEELLNLIHQLKITMFCLGAKNIKTLKRIELLVS